MNNVTNNSDFEEIYNEYNKKLEDMNLRNIMEAIKVHKIYIDNLRKAIISLDKELVKNIYLEKVKEEEEKIKAEDNSLSDIEVFVKAKEKVSLSFLQEMKRIFGESKQELNICDYPQYINVVEPILGKNSFILTLWYLEEKEAVTEILKHTQVNIKEDVYDKFMKTIPNYIVSTNSLLYSVKYGANIEEHKNQLKKDFFILLKYSSLENTLKKEVSIKSIKKI